MCRCVQAHVPGRRLGCQLRGLINQSKACSVRVTLCKGKQLLGQQNCFSCCQLGL